MHKMLVNILCAFIPQKQKRDMFRRRILSKKKWPNMLICGEDNKIMLLDANGASLPCRKPVPELKIYVQGKRNKIIFHEPLPTFRNSNITLVGDDNIIEIGSSPYRCDDLNISCKWPCNKRLIKIGDDFSCGRTEIAINEDNAIFTVGNDCNFSNFIEIRTDGHAILDQSGNVINSKCDIKIGNHCWVGTRCMILKEAHLPDNCILGAGSLLNKKHNDKNCVYAGIPAKKVKEKIYWERENASIYRRKK